MATEVITLITYRLREVISKRLAAVKGSEPTISPAYMAMKRYFSDVPIGTEKTRIYTAIVRSSEAIVRAYSILRFIYSVST